MYRRRMHKREMRQIYKLNISISCLNKVNLKQILFNLHSGTGTHTHKNKKISTKI